MDGRRLQNRKSCKIGSETERPGSDQSCWAHKLSLSDWTVSRFVFEALQGVLFFLTRLLSFFRSPKQRFILASPFSCVPEHSQSEYKCKRVDLFFCWCLYITTITSRASLTVISHFLRYEIKNRAESGLHHHHHYHHYQQPHHHVFDGQICSLPVSAAAQLVRDHRLVRKWVASRLQHSDDRLTWT